MPPSSLNFSPGKDKNEEKGATENESTEGDQQRELPPNSPFAVAVPSDVQPLPSVFLDGSTNPVAKRLKVAMQVCSTQNVDIFKKRNRGQP